MTAQTQASDGEQKSSAVLALAALGIVYGDIGTSPLYALHQCFFGVPAMPPHEANVLGILSLIFWTLVIVISLKYMLVVLRADNRGEGGIMALMTQIVGEDETRIRRRGLAIIGMFGAALLYGDGIITPAISVLSAVEGLAVATPAFDPFVVPMTIAILIGLFVAQHRGTQAIGQTFGPVMAVWFLTLGVLGIGGIAEAPRVLAAANPWHAVRFFYENGFQALVVFGAVFLVVTGGEALYADMGHVGRPAIRQMWYGLVLPGLLLNYFGQGALILVRPGDVQHSFYSLAPHWALYPLVALATVATVIASQAVISGAYSLTRQAIQLDRFPPLRITQTSAAEIGQIYIPMINWALMFGTIGLVVGFQQSVALAAAYGVAVTTTMLITTILVFFFVRERLKWPLWGVVPVVGLFLCVDLGFFAANILKIPDGGWLPLAVGIGVFSVMAIWNHGDRSLARATRPLSEPLEEFVALITRNPPARVPGTAVFLTRRYWRAPAMLLQVLALSKTLPERLVIMTVVAHPVPRIAAAERVDVKQVADRVWRVIANYGYMQTPNVPLAVRRCESFGLEIDPQESVFFIGHETILPQGRALSIHHVIMATFDFLHRNSTRATAFYRLPPNRVVEIGLQIKV